MQSNMCLCVFKIKFIYAEQIEIEKFNSDTSLSPTNNCTIGFIAPPCFG
jgi:hypothetical protein